MHVGYQRRFICPCKHNVTYLLQRLTQELLLGHHHVCRHWRCIAALFADLALHSDLGVPACV